MRLLLALALAALLAGCAQPLAANVDTGLAPLPALSCGDACRLAIDEGPGAAFEPMVVANPNDPQHLVAGYSEHTVDAAGNAHRWNKAAVSKDGGKTWTTTRLPGGPGAGPGHPLFHITDMGDASVAILDDGTVVYTGLALHFVTNDRAPIAGGITGYSLYAARSTDGGLSYPEIAIVAQGRGVAGWLPVATPLMGNEFAAAWHANDKNWVAAGPDGLVLLAWSTIQMPPLDRPTDLYALDLTFALSKDDGRTWTEPAPIRTDGSYSGAFPAIGADGTLYVAHIAYGEPGVHLAASKDEGKSWTSERITEEGSVYYPNFPSLVASRAGGGERLYVAYTHEDADAKTETPRLTWSDDGGASWAAPIDLATPGARIWTQPALAVSPEGAALVAFYRADDEDATKELLVATVRDGQVARLVVDAALEGATGRRGHYIGVAAAPGGALPVWVGNDPGSFDVLAALVATGQP